MRVRFKNEIMGVSCDDWWDEEKVIVPSHTDLQRIREGSSVLVRQPLGTGVVAEGGREKGNDGHQHQQDRERTT